MGANSSIGLRKNARARAHGALLHGDHDLSRCSAKDHFKRETKQRTGMPFERVMRTRCSPHAPMHARIP